MAGISESCRFYLHRVDYVVVCCAPLSLHYIQIIFRMNRFNNSLSSFVGFTAKNIVISRISATSVMAESVSTIHAGIYFLLFTVTGFEFLTSYSRIVKFFTKINGM